MGLLEMGYSDPTADLHVEGVCVDFDRFLADLESVAGTTDDKCEEFPDRSLSCTHGRYSDRSGAWEIETSVALFRGAGRMAFHSWL